jgi:transposase
VSFIDGDSRDQISLVPACIDDYVAPDSLVRVVDAFVASLDLVELGFNRAVAAATGRPGFGWSIRALWTEWRREFTPTPA